MQKLLMRSLRYSIMLQLVGFIALVLVGSAALFAWIQTRTAAESQSLMQPRNPSAQPMPIP